MVSMRVTLIGVDRSCNDFMYEFSPFSIVHVNDEVDTFNMEYRQVWRI